MQNTSLHLGFMQTEPMFYSDHLEPGIGFFHTNSLMIFFILKIHLGANVKLLAETGRSWERISRCLWITVLYFTLCSRSFSSFSTSFITKYVHKVQTWSHLILAHDSNYSNENPWSSGTAFYELF